MMAAVSEYVHERCEVRHGATVWKTDLYHDYEVWALGEDCTPHSMAEFSRRLMAMGMIDMSSHFGGLCLGEHNNEETVTMNDDVKSYAMELNLGAGVPPATGAAAVHMHVYSMLLPLLQVLPVNDALALADDIAAHAANEVFGELGGVVDDDDDGPVGLFVHEAEEADYDG